MFQSWGLDTEVHQSPISSPSCDHTRSYGLVTFQTRNQEPPKGEIVPRFLKDPRSAFLVLWTQLMGFWLYDVTMNIAYFSVARPFCMRQEIRAQLPDVLPKRLILNNHHRVGIQDQEFQTMFVIGNLQKTFRVLQSPGMIEPAMLRTQGARLMRTGDPHWTILSTFLQANEKTTSSTKANYKHHTAITIFPDRDGQLSDNDEHIGQGLGSFATSLALRVPILDICTYMHQDEQPGTVYIKSHSLQGLLEKFSQQVPPLQDLDAEMPTDQEVPTDQEMSTNQEMPTRDTFAAWRKKHERVIQAQACEAKKLFLGENTIERPMCPIDFHPTNHTLDIGRMARNDNMYNRYKC